MRRSTTDPSTDHPTADQAVRDAIGCIKASRSSDFNDQPGAARLYLASLAQTHATLAVAERIAELTRVLAQKNS